MPFDSVAKKDKKDKNESCRGKECKVEISGINNFRINISADDILHQQKKVETSNFCAYPGHKKIAFRLKWDDGKGKGYLENAHGQKIRYKLGVSHGANQSRMDHELTRGASTPVFSIRSLRPCNKMGDNFTLILEIDGAELAQKPAGRYGNDKIKITLETE